VQHLPGVRCFYDMNLREDHWNVPLVERLSRLCTVLKLNEDEAKALVPQIPALEAFCATWAEEFDIETICVTLGAAGSLVYQRNPQTNESSIVRVPGYSIQVQDTVGAGDAFAAAFLHGYHLGGPIVETAKMANAVGALVANRAGATPEWSVAECKAMMAAEAVQALRTHDAKFI
jgi:fructokinase